MFYWQICLTFYKMQVMINKQIKANRYVRSTCVSSQLTADAHVSFTGLQVVDGADVVQATTGNIVPRRGVGARHHPGGAQRDSMNLEESRKI